MNEENMLYYPLSGYEMKKLNPDAKIIKYTELNKIKDINELFKDTDKIIILYLLHSRYSGHWVCLFKNHQGFNFFDSYGYKPDYHLDFLTKKQRKEYNEKQKVLLKLLKPYEVIYNSVKLQNKLTETCGCHVTVRLHFSYLTELEYITDIFLKNKIRDPDVFVARYCLDLLNE